MSIFNSLPVIVNPLGICFSEWNLFNFDKIGDGWTRKSRRHWIQVLAILGNFSDNLPKPYNQYIYKNIL